MTEKLPVRGFRWMDDISKIDEKLVKDYDYKKTKKSVYLIMEKC